ncbi:T9SS type A sorting domain-containing protein, partial [candidate division WOR-3 bacterium]|nr:T9SS type A sorting domain-containing protein [candidate division WOR-3 bacterium]
SGTGTQGHDLAAGGLTVARFVKLVDDGSGGSGGYAGFDLDAIEAVAVNAPAIVYQGQTVIDSPPGGNADGKLDKGENADLVVTLKNAGRLGVTDLAAVLRTNDAYVTVQDSLGFYGAILPDSTRSNHADRFHLAAAANTPLEHPAQMRLYLSGSDYADSVLFIVAVGEILATDPIPDGPRTPPLYWAYDNVDTAYAPHPSYEWVEINSLGTRINYSQNDEVRMVSLPSGFGPLRFYGQEYTQVSVSADGWVACGNYTQSSYNNTSLPSTSAPRATVFLNWDDLYPSSGGGGAGYVYWYHDAGNHRFIVEYDSVRYYSGSEQDKFQAIYYDTTVTTPSGDNVVVVQYKTAAGMTGSTVGIQDPTRAIAIQVLYNGALTHGAAPMVPERAIKYTTTDPSGIAEPVAGLMPDSRLTLQAERNPTLGQVTLRYHLPEPGDLTVAVYDRAGRLVRQLSSGPRRAGSGRVIWDGADAEGHKVGAGVYLFRMVTGGKSVVQKATVVR